MFCFSSVIPTQSLMLLGRNSSTEWKSVMQELTLHKEEVERLREELEDVKLQFKHEIEGLREQVREEKERFERLEEQMNDLTELHQHEVENIKSGYFIRILTELKNLLIIFDQTAMSYAKVLYFKFVRF